MAKEFNLHNMEFAATRNAHAAAFAMEAIRLYMFILGYRTNRIYDAPLTDLLADLRHLCDVVGISFSHIDDRASQRYIGNIGEARAEEHANQWVPHEISPVDVDTIRQGQIWTRHTGVMLRLKARAIKEIADWSDEHFDLALDILRDAGCDPSRELYNGKPVLEATLKPWGINQRGFIGMERIPTLIESILRSKESEDAQEIRELLGV